MWPEIAMNSDCKYRTQRTHQHASTVQVRLCFRSKASSNSQCEFTACRKCRRPSQTIRSVATSVASHRQPHDLPKTFNHVCICWIQRGRFHASTGSIRIDILASHGVFVCTVHEQAASVRSASSYPSSVCPFPSRCAVVLSCCTRWPHTRV